MMVFKGPRQAIRPCEILLTKAVSRGKSQLKQCMNVCPYHYQLQLLWTTVF